MIESSEETLVLQIGTEEEEVDFDEYVYDMSACLIQSSASPRTNTVGLNRVDG